MTVMDSERVPLSIGMCCGCGEPDAMRSGRADPLGFGGSESDVLDVFFEMAVFGEMGGPGLFRFGPKRPEIIGGLRGDHNRLA
jgi:hypothetical protein